MDGLTVASYRSSASLSLSFPGCKVGMTVHVARLLWGLETRGPLLSPDSRQDGCGDSGGQRLSRPHAHVLRLAVPPGQAIWGGIHAQVWPVLDHHTLLSQQEEVPFSEPPRLLFLYVERIAIVLDVYGCCNNYHKLSGLRQHQLIIQYGSPWATVKVSACLCSLRVLVTQSCPTLCDPMDCSPPGSSILGILQARILEWIAIPFSRGSSWLRDWTHVSSASCISRKILYHWATCSLWRL